MTNNIRTNSNSKGFSSIILIVVLAGVLILFGLYMYKLISDATTQEDLAVNKPAKQIDISGETPPEHAEAYEELDEPEGTPEEINNEVLDELDSIMLELEADTTLDDDLSDL